MSRTAGANDLTGGGSSRMPVGKFLDDLPKGLYVLAHLVFLGVGLWLWAQAGENAAPPAALGLYALSQVGFLAYFADGITMKMAVLAEQTLVFAMVLLIFLRGA